MSKKIAIVGASGYTGRELIRLLHGRPGFELACLNSESCRGRPLSELDPDADPGLRFTDFTIEEINRLPADVVFLCQADGFAAAHASEFGGRVIDLSRDLRFAEGVAYGLPELNRKTIRDSRLVANPGCYATACVLAGLPAVQSGLVERVVFDCASGCSGAGRTPSERNDPRRLKDNILAYKLTEHPHQNEIRHGLGLARVSFTPHVLPFFRGILATGHLILGRKTDPDAIREMYRKFYAAEPFVRVLDRVPDLHDVQGTNLCCLGGFETDDADRLVVVAAIDNLLKGASGQAVQNMNLMLGRPEAEGLN
jgi:N-acetyl-gamma-glutamyl-phosphate reductase